MEARWERRKRAGRVPEVTRDVGADLALTGNTRGGGAVHSCRKGKSYTKEGAKIELLREICQILSDLSDLQV